LDSLFIVRFDYSELLPQSSGKRGGAGSYFISSVYVGVGKGGGRRRGRKQKVIPGLSGFAGKSQTIHTWSDRASNYFVSGEDDIKPGSIPSDPQIFI
jgi:hypothetical protein